MHFNIRLPNKASEEIVDYLYDIYYKNKKIDKIMNRGGMNANMERMLILIQHEAFFIKDHLASPHTIDSGHEAVLDILKKYQSSQGDKQKPINTEVLYFKDNEAAWEIAEKYFPTESDDKLVAENQYLARLLENYEGLDHKTDEVAVSTTNTSSFCVAIFPKNHPKKYPKGTLVFYTPVYLLDQYESIPNIWMGVINAIVAPELTPNKGWKILEKFTKN